MDESVLRTLEEVGLTDKEARIYTALLSLGRGDITQISREAGLKRSNCYALLEKLERRGYVSPVAGQRVQQYTPSDPARLLHNFQSHVSTFRDMLPVIRALFNQPGRKPRVQYFEGEKAVRSVYREIDRFPEAFLISSLDRFQRDMPDEAAYWTEAHVRGKILYKGKYLLTKTEADKAFAKKISGPTREVRWLPGNQDLGLDFTIYANRVAITSLEKPPFMVLIESDDFAKSMKILFNIIWNSGEKYRKK